MDSYDNDWLFLDDDLFCVWVDEYKADKKAEKEKPDDGISVLPTKSNSIRSCR